mgnify:CR=1 FL=1
MFVTVRTGNYAADMDMDDMVVMMQLLDANGDAQVTKCEFAAYYKRLKDCDDATFEAVWRDIDANADGILQLHELCRFYNIDTGECERALAAQKDMDDAKLLEALQQQSLVHEKERQRRVHAERLRALADLADEVEEGEEEAVGSPTSVIAKAASDSPTHTTLTLQDVIRDSKRRGNLAAYHFCE